MIYQIKHTRHNFWNEKYIKVVFILLPVFLIIFFLSIFNPTRSLVLNVFLPFIKTGNYFYSIFDKIPKFISDKNILIEENERLLTQIEDDRLFKIDYESIKYENQKLREEIKLRPSEEFKTVSIIAKSPQIPLDSLLLNIGTEDNVKNGDFILAADRIIIGKVVEVSTNVSTVALNSFAGVNSFGFVARTSEPIEIIGTGGGNMEAKVPIDFDIVLGDKVMISNSLNYLAAVVGLVEEEESLGFKKIILSLPLNVSKINTVFVVSIANQ